MRVAFIASELFQREWQAHILPDGGEDEISWHRELNGMEDVNVVIDLLFTLDTERVEQLARTGADLILVNLVPGTLDQLPDHFARINGWPGAVAGEWIEVAGKDKLRAAVEKLFLRFGKKTAWLPDKPGFISPRVIATIINEAYLALGDKVSSRDGINTAMKLGTNYPHGPFEWAGKIGIQRVCELLQVLAKDDPRYQPASLLIEEAKS